MDDPSERVQSSPLLMLPAEIRLHIYSYILPQAYLLVDLCPGKPTVHSAKGKSIVGGLLKQHTKLMDTIRGHGLHLLLVCKSIRVEILPVLNAITARFHCDGCYAYFLKTVVQGTSIGVKWLRHVQIEVQLDHSSHNANAARLEQAGQILEKVQKLTWTHCGRLDLMEREKWSLQDMRHIVPRNVQNNHAPPFRILPMLHNSSSTDSFWLVTGLLHVPITNTK